MMLNSKQKIIAIAGVTAVILIVALLRGYTKPKAISVFPKQNPSQTTSPAQDESPRIVSTKPDPLDDTIIPANQTIEITFNRSLQNVPEFKVRIEPKVDLKVELSGDRKTAKIIPTKPYELGSSYTLYIAPDTKFDGVGNWGTDKTFHFRTIKYTGV